MTDLPRGQGDNRNVSLGTAGWMPAAEAEQLAYEPGALWLGRSETEAAIPIGWRDDRHVITVAGTRAGKGTSLLVNNLCLYPGSVVCIDPKGENATLTAARRGQGSDTATPMGQRVYVLDPFNAAQVDQGYRAAFNPLDWIDTDNPEASDEAKRLADSLVVVAKGEDAHWDESARSVIEGLILHVLHAIEYEGRRNLLTVRQLLTRGDTQGVAEYVAYRRATEPEFEMPEPSAAAFDFLWKAMAESKAFHGIVAGVGASVLSMADRELSSVLSTARRNTDFLDSPLMRPVLDHSTFSLDALKSDPAGVTVYLCLPARYMNTHARWLRMMVGLTLDGMERLRGRPMSGHPVLLVLDEFAILDRMASLEKAIGQIAGFGVKIWAVLQDLTQLKALYKERWETFLGNAGLAMFFGNADQFTLDYISRRLGKVEVRKDVANRGEQVGSGTGSSYNPSGVASWGLGALTALIPGLSRSRQEGVAWGTSETVQKTELLNPDEAAKIFAAETGRMLAITPNHYPIAVRRTPYFADPAFAGLFDPHPDHGAAAAPAAPAAPPPAPERGETERLYAPEITEGLFRQPSHGTLMKWHSASGAAFKAGDLLAEIETRRQIIEVLALCDGVMRAHTTPEGGIVRSGLHLADIWIADAPAV
ncbi:type IV secretory system conjugative DNA transfer family protein [Sphingomonas sp.]|uniref:type IV secretory system conjugative DNA transfer family protein n=1 Tax=Sphingomonas sp. TaxID=28214 RepID=UPI001B2026D4|nr:type IV secretory system conjugative DNA transfer family protein [Sphingomonas sp.]MBO9712684.1 type IV secretory system conjugative DNA transfer family protein [Sphingomonas sp.]